mmetsp:Transcript_93417/g.263712  ORF Transcript_93417/g.263712 Transcript_93417/m.263712 type:complete len:225 (+) Transcript_93417:209-883(+)
MEDVSSSSQTRTSAAGVAPTSAEPTSEPSPMAAPVQALFEPLAGDTTVATAAQDGNCSSDHLPHEARGELPDGGPMVDIRPIAPASSGQTLQRPSATSTASQHSFESRPPSVWSISSRRAATANHSAWWCDVVLASAAVDLDAWNSKWNAMEADIASVEHIGVSKAEGRPMRHCLKTSSLYRAGSSATADYKWLSMQSELQAIDRRSAGDGPLNRDMMHLVTAR